jgi:DNA-binding transcriptional MerR regulator
MTETHEQFLTVAEATRECARHDADLSEATLKRAADRGLLPCIRTAGRGVRLFKLEDVRTFAQARRA